MKIEVGQWALKEGLVYGRFGHPVLITKVVGKRVYYERMHRNSKGEIEDRSPGFCHVKTIRYIVPTEEIGMHLCQRVREIREDERRAAADVAKTYNVIVRETMAAMYGVEPVSMS